MGVGEGEKGPMRRGTLPGSIAFGAGAKTPGVYQREIRCGGAINKYLYTISNPNHPTAHGLRPESYPLIEVDHT